jgi:hypothetical protein
MIDPIAWVRSERKVGPQERITARAKIPQGGRGRGRNGKACGTRA